MKTLSLILLSCLPLMSFAQPNHSSALVQALPAIQQMVRQCAIVPISFNANGQATQHPLISRCPEVKILGVGAAQVKVEGRLYFAIARDSVDSDGGDLSLLTLHDARSGETYKVNNILAFGDVLLAVLMGDTRGVVQNRFRSGL